MGVNIYKFNLPEYAQNILTDGKGLITPIQKLMVSVKLVMVIDTAASESVLAIRSGTGRCGEVRRQAANITNVSSIPIPETKPFVLLIVS